MIPSTYVPTMVEETNVFKQLKSCYIISGPITFDVTSNLPSWLPFLDSPVEIGNKIDAGIKAIYEVLEHHNKQNNGDEDSESDSDYSALFGNCGISTVHQPEIKTFMLALPNNRVLSLSFNYQGRTIEVFIALVKKS